MKVRLIHDVQVENPEWDFAARNADLYYNVPRSVTAPKGTILERADAHNLVILGHAVAEDDECRAKLAELGVSDQEILVNQAKRANPIGLDFAAKRRKG
jgi:hypothetical protein